MMGTTWSSLFVRFVESIEWNYLNTIPWNHTRIWMKDVHLCLQNTWDHRIVRSLIFFTLEFLYTCMKWCLDSSLVGLLWSLLLDVMLARRLGFVLLISLVNMVIGQCKKRTIQFLFFSFFKWKCQLLGGCTLCLKARKWIVMCVVSVFLSVVKLDCLCWLCLCNLLHYNLSSS